VRCPGPIERQEREVGTYLAEAALTQLDEAQAELERHLNAGPGGRCRACGEIEPCLQRGRLYAVFALCGRLPRRRPVEPIAGSTTKLRGGRPVRQCPSNKQVDRSEVCVTDGSDFVMTEHAASPTA
jgi:hypothetical protein